MKKGIALILTAALLLTGCGGTSAQAGTQEKTDAAQEEAVATEEASADEAEKTEAQEPAAAAENTDTASEEAPQETATAASDTLVLYFSRTGEQYVVGVIDKGNTAIVAEMIAEQTGADLFEVLPADDHYPMTYDALTDVAKQEQNDKARPAYSGELPDLSKYSTIFIGAPVWWGDWPMIMYTFFENNADSLAGKTLVTFSTHEGSGLSGFDKKLSSEVGFKGIFKKVLIFLLVGIAEIIDVQVLGQEGVIRTAVIFFYLSNEGVSLLENAGHLGLPIPAQLKDVLEQLHNRSEKEEES